MSHPSILRRLPEIARALIPQARFDPDIRSRHFAFLLDKSKILRVGWNSYKSHPEIQRRGYPNYTRGLHAELSLFTQGYIDSCRGLSVAVLRFNWNDCLDHSRPCPCCRGVLTQMEIKHTWFTNATGGWERTK